MAVTDQIHRNNKRSCDRHGSPELGVLHGAGAKSRAAGAACSMALYAAPALELPRDRPESVRVRRCHARSPAAGCTGARAASEMVRRVGTGASSGTQLIAFSSRRKGDGPPGRCQSVLGRPADRRFEPHEGIRYAGSVAELPRRRSGCREPVRRGTGARGRRSWSSRRAGARASSEYGYAVPALDLPGHVCYVAPPGNVRIADFRPHRGRAADRRPHVNIYDTSVHDCLFEIATWHVHCSLRRASK